MRQSTHKAILITAAALLTACTGGDKTTSVLPPATGVNPDPAPIAYRLLDGYLAQPEVPTDSDFDSIPDAFDAYPDQHVVQADAFGDSAFVIDRVYSATPSGDLEAAATGTHELTIIGHGMDYAGGEPLLIFTGGLEPVAVTPTRIDATTWKVTPPKGAAAVFAVRANERSNSFAIRWLSADAPKLYRVEAPVSTGSIIELDGIDLGNVNSIKLGIEELEIVSSSDSRLQVRLPSAPTSNVLQVENSGMVSNVLELELQHEISVQLDSALSLPVGTTVLGRHRAASFEITTEPSTAIAVTGHTPYAFYFAANGENSQLGTIAWPDQSNVTISSATTLMTELWIQRLSLPMNASMDWRDARAFLQNTLLLPESQAFISGHQAWIAGDNSWDRYAARQLVMDAVAASNATTTASKSTVQQAAMIDSEELDDIVAFTISSSTIDKPGVGANSTLEYPRADIPGTSYAQIEVAAHDEERLLFDICGYPPNTPVPAGIWPSDLCVQNGTAVLASFAVYQPDKKTFGIPFVANPADLVRKHIDSPGSTEAASEGAAYLTDNRNGGPNQPTLCRMQTCFVEVLTSGFGNTFKDAALTTAQKKVVRDLRMKWVFEGMIVPIIAKKLGMAQVPACLAGEIYANDKIYTKIEDFVEGIRDDRASHTIVEAKQLFDDIVAAWLKGILTGALAENGNIVNCVATETTKSAIKDAFIDATEFGGILNDVMFVGGLILTPEKFTFKVQYLAEVANVEADTTPDNVSTLVDTVNGLYWGAAQNPRMLSITGTWIADQNQGDPGKTFYPEVVFRDNAGNIERIVTDASHYVETNDVSIRRLDIPLLTLVDENTGTDLNNLVPGKVDVTLNYIHTSFPGYDNGILRVASPVGFILKNKPRLEGFTPPSATPGSLMTANGTSLDALGGTPKVDLYRHSDTGNFSCDTADQQTKKSVPPADVLSLPGGKEISFLLPDDLDLDAFYYVCLTPTSTSSATTTASTIIHGPELPGE